MAQNIAITRKRGDTYRIRITFTKDDGSPLDLSNSSLLMTVSPIALPDEASDALFTIIGSIVGAATDGVADFQQTAAQADHVGDFYYDVEMTDVSGGYVWTPSGVVDDRWLDWNDASGPFRGWLDCDDDTENWWEFKLRDGVPVVKWMGATTGTWFTFEFAGDADVGGAWGPSGVWEYTGLIYWAIGVDLLGGSDLYDICHTLISIQSDRVRLECESYHPYGWDNASENVNFMHTDRTVDEWMAFRYRIDCDTPQVSGKAWYPADPTDWEADEPGAWNGQVGLATAPLRTVLPVRWRLDGGSGATPCEIAFMGWEKLS
jgi:hypothetical protein